MKDSFALDIGLDPEKENKNFCPPAKIVSVFRKKYMEEDLQPQ